MLAHDVEACLHGLSRCHELGQKELACIEFLANDIECGDECPVHDVERIAGRKKLLGHFSHRALTA